MNLIGIGAGLGGLLKGYEQAGQFVQQQQMNNLRIQQARQQMQQEQQLNQLLDNPALFSQFSQGGGQMPAIGTGMAGGGVDPSQLPNTSMMGPQAATPMPAQPSVRRQPAMAPTPMPQVQAQPVTNYRYADPFDPGQSMITDTTQVAAPGTPGRAYSNPGLGTGTDPNNPNAPPPEVTLRPDLMRRFQQLQSSGGAPDTVVPSNTLDLIERDESGGRNIMQTAYSGEGINPSTGTHTAPSTAQGYYQITNSTWREAAPQAGVDVSQYPTAMSAPKEIQRQVAAHLLKTQGTAPWAPYNAKLRADLGQGGGEDTLAASAPTQAQRQAQTVAQNSLWNIPPQMYGRMQLQTAAQMIEKAAPNAPGHIKFMALEKLQKILAPDAKVEMQMLMLNQREMFSGALKQMEIDAANQRAATAAANKSETPFKGDDGNFYVMRGGKAVKVEGLEPGTNLTRVGTGGSDLPKPDPDAVAMIKDFIKGGLNVPYSFRGGKQGQANMSAALAELGKEGVKAGEIAGSRADVAANARSQANLTRIYDQTKAYEGLAEKNLDAAVAQSANAVPTDFGPFLNRWIMTGQTQFGDENVPAYTMNVIAATNELARVLSASTGAAGLTDTARREAAEVLSPYFSAGQFAAAAKVAKQEMKRRMTELETGLSEIRQRTRTGEAPGAAPAGGAPSAAAPSPIMPGAPATAVGPAGEIHYDPEKKAWVDKDGNPVQ